MSACYYLLSKDGGIEAERINLCTFGHGQHWEESSGLPRLLGVFARFSRSFTTGIFITLEIKVFCLSAELINSVRPPLNVLPVCPCGAELVLPGGEGGWGVIECHQLDLGLFRMGARIHWAFHWELLTLFWYPHGLIFLVRVCKLWMIGKTMEDMWHHKDIVLMKMDLWECEQWSRENRKKARQFEMHELYFENSQILKFINDHEKSLEWAIWICCFKTMKPKNIMSIRKKKKGETINCTKCEKWTKLSYL